MVNSFLTDSHLNLQAAVRRFAEEEVSPAIDDMERTRSVQRALSRRIAGKGWIGVTIDPSYGGMGQGHLAKTIIIEELARVSGAMGAMVQASQLGVAKILHFGNEKQKATWLPEIANGRCLPTIAVTEKETGGDVDAMTTTARRDGDHYVLNGRKVFIGNSHIGDLHGVVARTAEGRHGLSAFLVESDRPGLSLGDHRPAIGLHGFSFGELIFDDCRIPVDNRLGEEGDGLAVADSSSILYGRPNLTAVALGIHQAIADATITFAQRQRRAGKALADVITNKQRIGQIHSHLMTARLTAYYAAHLLDRGLPCDAELINAKLRNVEFALDSVQIAMHLHGAPGLFPDHLIERYARDALCILSPAGTPDVQRKRLAEIAMGRYTVPWSQLFASKVVQRRIDGS